MGAVRSERLAEPPGPPTAAVFMGRSNSSIVWVGSLPE
jgi:hypothetical protein